MTERPDIESRRVWSTLIGVVLLFLVLMVAYEAARDRVAPADASQVPYENARSVIDAERSLSLFIEPDVQRAVHEVPGGRWATTWFYTVAYTAGYIAFLAWVFFVHRPWFWFMFTWYWITNGLAVLGYWLYPLAPPRFMENLGMEDTTEAALELGGALSWFQPFRNLFAAMPSMHVGQTILYAMAIGFLVTSRRRHLAWLWPLAMLITVMATANHYWLDGAVGGLVVLVALGLTIAVTRRVPWATPTPQNSPG